MNTKHLYWILPILGFGIMYLGGCFCEVSFNISIWDEKMRGVVGIFGSIFFVTGLFIAAIFNCEE